MQHCLAHLWGYPAALRRQWALPCVGSTRTSRLLLTEHGFKAERSSCPEGLDCLLVPEHNMCHTSLSSQRRRPAAPAAAGCSSALRRLPSCGGRSGMGSGRSPGTC